MKRILYLDRPAENWETTSPLGNGLMGVILFGGTENEKIYLNE
ncbi:MAG: glycoside hydrolase N-terminal domain-containing protein [Clostridia bacterium]|nr:glycoside hydrolase N-terminal domain-containing protein [Clostridia bacterium]